MSFRCSYCGKFIAIQDFQEGRANSQLDYDYSGREDIWFFHRLCKIMREDDYKKERNEA